MLDTSMVDEITPEKAKTIAIRELTAMPGWKYLIEDFERLVEENEAYIYDINTPMDERKAYSIVVRNILRAFIDKPQELIEALKSFDK